MPFSDVTSSEPSADGECEQVDPGPRSMTELNSTMMSYTAAAVGWWHDIEQALV